ncbi:unnamed protein product, partial [Didymodactylos carnosus]
LYKQLYELYSEIKSKGTNDGIITVFCAQRPQPTFLTLGLILVKMGEYKIAEKYYKHLIDELSSDHRDLAMIYNNMGEMFPLQGDDKAAESQ